MLKRFGMGMLTPLVGIGQKGADILGGGHDAGADGAAAEFLAAKQRLASQAGIKPGQNNTADTLGQIASPVNYAGGALIRGGGMAARLGAAALAGAFSGGTQPDASANPLVNAAKGAGFGAAGGLVLGAGAELLAPFGLGVNAMYRYFSKASGGDAIHDAAVAKILAKTEADQAGGGPSATQAIAATNEARARGAPMALADAGGKNLRRLAGSLSRAPGAPAALAEKHATAQMEQASKRLSSIVNEHITSGPTMRKTADALTAGQRAEAAPLYEQAFKPGSVAPLKKQFEFELNAILKSTKEATEELAAAQRVSLQAAAKVHRAGNNVYATNAALRAKQEAEQALRDAQTKVAAARKQSIEVLSRLREAQNAEQAGQRGGVWSPRIQQFLTDPTIKPAIAKGMEIQRLLALAEGRKFDPYDFAIIGEKDGEPVVGRVPNMRLLDAVKKGIDDMLEHYRSDITGKLVLDERGRALDQARRSYITAVDELNPIYAKARAAYAGPAASKGTMLLGSKHFGRHVEDNQQLFEELSPSQKQFYLVGVADHLRDKISEKGVTAPIVAGLKEGSHNNRVKEQMKMLFPDEAKFKSFLAAVTDERTIFERAGERLKGSPSAERLAADAENGISAAGHAIAAGGHIASGNPLGAAAALARAKRDLGIIGNHRVNEAMAKILFDPSIDLNSAEGLKFAARVPLPRDKLLSYARRFRQLTGPGAAVAGVAAGQGEQPGDQ
jgi:hypothetical protein